MKPFINTLIIVFIFMNTIGYSQTSRLTIEPAIGIHANFGTDVIISNLVQWNSDNRICFGAYSAFDINNVTQRHFNNVHTNYNYSLNQKFGIGLTFPAKKITNVIFLMAGAKYTAFKETLENPNLDEASARVRTLTADYGLMYSIKRGQGKYFFAGRFYLPLSPWLTKGMKADNIQGTLRDVALEVGFGIRIKSI